MNETAGNVTVTIEASGKVYETICKIIGKERLVPAIANHCMRRRMHDRPGVVVEFSRGIPCQDKPHFVEYICSIISEAGGKINGTFFEIP